jgi:membrane protein YqaA with SNARE-associated domain
MAASQISGRFFVLIALAFAWGLSEATVFFVVPDVIISFIALEYGYKKGLLAVCASVAGAMLGGALIYAWGKADIMGARAFFDLLPAIAPATIERASSEVTQPGLGLTMLTGSMTGVPFKLYASEAGAFGTPLGWFIALTPLVRLPRFLIAATFAATVGKWAPYVLLAHKFKLMAGFWVVFYAIYWLNAPW